MANNNPKLFLYHILPTLVWVSVIFYLCSAPASTFPHLPLLEAIHFDKVVHAGMHFVLAFLLSGWFKNQKQFTGLQKNAFLYAVLICAFYGGTMELLQKYIFTSRSAEWGDEAANIVGALLGIWAFKVIMNFLQRRKEGKE